MSSTELTVRTSDDRILRLIAHGGTLFAWFLAPLCVYLVTRRSSSRVAEEALQSLLWSALGTVLALPTFGLAVVVCLVFHMIGPYKALNDEPFDYPLVARFARQEA